MSISNESNVGLGAMSDDANNGQLNNNNPLVQLPPLQLFNNSDENNIRSFSTFQTTAQDLGSLGFGDEKNLNNGKRPYSLLVGDSRTANTSIIKNQALDIHLTNTSVSSQSDNDQVGEFKKRQKVNEEGRFVETNYPSESGTDSAANSKNKDGSQLKNASGDQDDGKNSVTKDNESKEKKKNQDHYDDSSSSDDSDSDYEDNAPTERRLPIWGKPSRSVRKRTIAPFGVEIDGNSYWRAGWRQKYHPDMNYVGWWRIQCPTPTLLKRHLRDAIRDGIAIEARADTIEVERMRKGEKVKHHECREQRNGQFGGFLMIYNGLCRRKHLKLIVWMFERGLFARGRDGLIIDREFTFATTVPAIAKPPNGSMIYHPNDYLPKPTGRGNETAPRAKRVHPKLYLRSFIDLIAKQLIWIHPPTTKRMFKEAREALNGPNAKPTKWNYTGSKDADLSD